MLQNKWAVLAKIESTYGTDPSPVVGSDLIYTSRPTVEPIFKRLERTHPQSGFGQTARVNIGDSMKCSFQVDLQDDWAAGADTPPSAGTLLRACNFTQTINTGTSIVYQNNSNQFTAESITLWIYLDSILYKINGARGMVKGSHKAGEKITLDFEFEGKLGASNYVADGSYPTYTVSLDTALIFENGEVAVGSYAAPIVENFNWDMGNVLERRPDANSANGVHSLYISNAIPKLDVDPEMVALSSFNPFSLALNNTIVDVTAIFKKPSESGTQCTLQINDLQYVDPKEGGARANTSVYAIQLEAAGNADVSLTFESA